MDTLTQVVLSSVRELPAVAQEVEQVFHKSQSWRFDAWLLLSMCRIVLGQEIQPQIAPDGQASILHGRLLPAVCARVNALDKSVL